MSDITLTMEGQLSYKDTISIAQAAKVISYLNADAELAPVSHSAATTVSDADPVVKDESESDPIVGSPREAIDKTAAKTNTEKIVALAAYLLQDGELDTFTMEQVRPQFQRAREPLPKNLSRDLDNAIQSGWVHPTGTKGQYYLTAAASTILDESFEVLRKRRTSPTRRTAPRARRAALQKPDTFDGIEEFAVNIPGIPIYHDIKTKRDKMLWAMKAAKEAGVNTLNHKDLAWLTDHLGEAILANHVGVNYGYLQKAGLANKTTNGLMRITPSGEAYLQTLSEGGS